jgi:hypothetical protein
MSSPCPGMDYVENAKRSEVTSPGYGPLGGEPMPEGESYPGGRDYGDESEHSKGLGDAPRESYTEASKSAIDLGFEHAAKQAQNTGGGVYDSAAINKAVVDPRTVPTKPIEDMTAREFLHFFSRNPSTPGGKRKGLAGIITSSDANYQAFIDIVAFHMLDNSSDFMLKVMESGAKEIQAGQQQQVLSLLNLLGEGR